MHKWRSSTRRAIVQLLIITQILLPMRLLAEDVIGWEPPSDAFICGFDKNGDAKWTTKGEASLCNKGSTFSPEKSYQTGNGYNSEPPTYSCPIDQVSCDKTTALFCPFTQQRCENGQTSCSQNTSCNRFTESYRDYYSCKTETKTTPKAACTAVTKIEKGKTVKGAYCPISKRTYWQDLLEPNDYLQYCATDCSVRTTEYVCPLSNNRYSDANLCSSDCWQWQQQDKYRCPVSGSEYYDQWSCNNNCVETRSCDPVKEFKCPLGDEYACVNLDLTDSSDNFACSKVACGAYSSNNQKEPVDRNMHIDDGNYSQEGECLGSIMIFAGRAMDCRTPGISSAYQNCCAKDDGEIYHDSMGSIADTYVYISAISTVYEAASVAYAAYSEGKTATEAANAATEFMQGAVDPTTLAITVAIMLIMNYLEKACPPEDIETAILDASGYCVNLGEKCTKKWFGSCVQEVEVKCCFNSKLARIIHEQGRPQINLSFGTAKEPNCRGFDAEEFQSLDFSKIDLSEYYQELRHKNQTEMQNGLQNAIKDKVGGQ